MDIQNTPTSLLPASLDAQALAVWNTLHNSDSTISNAPQSGFVKPESASFLLLINLESERIAKQALANDLLHIALNENACTVFHAISGQSLWISAACACCISHCNIYLNLDLLTIDPHTQDWGDFKIKPEQVEVQRKELTFKALFEPRHGFMVQVEKAALPTLMDMLRTANLAAHSTVIGSVWGGCSIGQSTLDIYRDAKKQASFSAGQLLQTKSAS